MIEGAVDFRGGSVRASELRYRLGEVDRNHGTLPNTLPGEKVDRKVCRPATGEAQSSDHHDDVRAGRVRLRQR